MTQSQQDNLNDQPQPRERGKLLFKHENLVRLRLFCFQLILIAILTFLLTQAEITRWRNLSEDYLSRKSITMAKAIEPHALHYIENRDIAGLQKLAGALTSSEIPHNDIISVQILDFNMAKLAESTQKFGSDSDSFAIRPSTMVVQEKIGDSEKGGALRIVFANHIFEKQHDRVVESGILFAFLTSVLALIIAWQFGRRINMPFTQLADAAKSIAEGNANVQIEAVEDGEVGALIDSFNAMSTNINVHLDALRSRNIELEAQAYKYATLQHVGRSLASILEQEQVYEAIVDSLINILSGVKRCSLLLVDEKRHEFVFKVVKGLEPEIIPANRRMKISNGIAAKVYNTCESVLMNDIAPGDSKELDEAKVTRSSICVPIKNMGKVTAILSIGNRISGIPFNETDLRLVEGVAQEAALAIKNANMWTDLKRKVLELNTLHEVGKTLGMVLDIDKLLEMVLGLTSKVLGGVKTSSVILYDQETKALQVVLYKGEGDVQQLQPIKVGEGIAGKVFEKGEPLIINDANPDSGLGRSSICVPLIFKDEPIGVLSVSNKLSGEPFDNGDLEILVTLASQIAVSLYNAQLYDELESSYLSAVKTLANSIDAKDAYTSGHSERVARYAVETGRLMGLDSDELKNLHIGALLHDIGKIGISESIITKSDRLTAEEYETIKTHPARGATILEPAVFLAEKVPLIRYHHERYDGKGYPEGLKGEKIPLLARIVCVADSFDAMTSKRAYRDVMPIKEAREEILRCSGSQFDPDVVAAFMKLLADDNKVNAIGKLGK